MKRIIAIVMALVISLSFVACGGNEASESGAASAEEKKPVLFCEGLKFGQSGEELDAAVEKLGMSFPIDYQEDTDSNGYLRWIKNDQSDSNEVVNTLFNLPEDIAPEGFEWGMMIYLRYNEDKQLCGAEASNLLDDEYFEQLTDNIVAHYNKVIGTAAKNNDGVYKWTVDDIVVTVTSIEDVIVSLEVQNSKFAPEAK